ncbi:uncharacterized protein LOC108629988 isoform X2 [Ceratina calcarata]|nr:uncharacterized protein LOC108629988 isoform X2 [Ceratina calcarata]
MLKAIAAHRSYPQLPASPAESPVRTPLPPKIPKVQQNEPFVNAVGNLQTLCTDNNLNSPEYQLISDVGPSHAKIFTIQCRVTTFVETGIAKTKKLAKQEAAKKMVDKLSDLIPDLSQIETKQYDEESHQLAKARYPALSRLPKKISMGVKTSDYHTIFRDSLEPDVRKELISKLKTLVEDKSTTKVVTPADVLELTNKFKEVLAFVNLEMVVLDISSKENTFVVAMRVNTSPDIVQMSIAKRKLEAEFHTLIKLINSMLVFLK